jgi:hypothetical protein
VLDFRRKSFSFRIARFGQVYFAGKNSGDHIDDACDAYMKRTKRKTDDMLETKGDKPLQLSRRGSMRSCTIKGPTEDSHPFWSTLLYEIDRLSYKPVRLCDPYHYF